MQAGAAVHARSLATLLATAARAVQDLDRIQEFTPKSQKQVPGQPHRANISLKQVQAGFKKDPETLNSKTMNTSLTLSDVKYTLKYVGNS